MAQATGLQSARTEMLKAVYGENAQLAGAGATQHVNRTEEFFRGAGLTGADRDAYIEKLAASGVPLIPTGFGLCGCNHASLEGPGEEKPPCYGDYQCHPDICKHAVVTEDALPSIQARLEHARAQVDAPDQHYARKHWIGVRDKLEALLGDLRITSRGTV